MLGSNSSLLRENSRFCFLFIVGHCAGDGAVARWWPKLSYLLQYGFLAIRLVCWQWSARLQVSPEQILLCVSGLVASVRGWEVVSVGSSYTALLDQNPPL